MAIKRKTFFDLDCFTDFYFMYMEDVDFGWKIQNNSLKSAVNCNSVIYHKSHSTNYKMFYNNVFRNSSWMIVKNAPYGLIVPMLILLLFSTITFTLVLFSRRNSSYKQPLQGISEAFFSAKSYSKISSLLNNKKRGIKNIYGLRQTFSSVKRIQKGHLV